MLRAERGTMSTYRAVMLTKKGGPETLQEVELPVKEPGPGELRIRVRACGVGYTDITMRRSYYPYAPKMPFVPGYEVIGEVDAIGPGVSGFQPGQRVAGLMVHGGYAELLVRSAADFIPVPDGLDDAEAVSLILNYVTAYQMIHRAAQLRPGQTALVDGANGGLGTALLELLRLHGCPAIGAASPKHHDAIRALGATPIESRSTSLDAGTRAVRPEGVDASFDGLGDVYVGQCTRATKRGGIVVAYGFTATIKNGNASLMGVLRTYTSLYAGARLAGRRSTFYGITEIYRKDPRPFREDLPKLFELLRQGSIRPRIAARLGLLEGRKAQEMLEAGGIDGKIVLVRGKT
jgi:NADPH2:quinone reductase